MKSRYWLSVYPAKVGRRGFRKILEATQGSLRLYEPTKRDSVLRALVTLAVFFGVLTGYVLLVGLVVIVFGPFSRFNGPNNIPLSTLPTFIALIGFGVTAYYSARFSNYLATVLKLRLTTRHPERTFPVHVNRIKPTPSGWVQLLELVSDGWAGWFNVPVTGQDLKKALSLADEQIQVELDR